MSFRTKLALFFVLLVVIPIAAIGVLAADVTEDSQAGKADARIATGLETAITVYEEQVTAADRALRQVIEDPAVSSALAEGDTDALASAADTAGREVGLSYLAITTATGEELEPTSLDAPVATATVGVTSGEDLELTGAVTSAPTYADRVEELIGLRAVVVDPDGGLAAGRGIAAESLPEPGTTADFDLDGSEARAATAALGDEGTAVTVVAPIEGDGLFDSSPWIAIFVAVFLAAALAGRRSGRAHHAVSDRSDAERRTAGRIWGLL